MQNKIKKYDKLGILKCKKNCYNSTCSLCNQNKCDNCINWEPNFSAIMQALRFQVKLNKKLIKSNNNLLFNQGIIQQAIIQMHDMFPEEWDKRMEEYKKKLKGDYPYDINTHS